MPGFNGTGPMGTGPMTGRGRGYCVVPVSNYDENNLNTGHGTVQDGYPGGYTPKTMPFQYGGMGYGRRIGRGRGRGYGRGRRFW